jgi:glycosyltransferase involved in cell wall biosynthesis
MKNSLFSVILLHYNQPRYVLTALQTILSQDYENIELVFADDASVAIDLEQIQAYIEQHKGDNIQNIIDSVLFGE